MSERQSLLDWIEENALDLQDDIAEHLKFVDLNEDERNFLLRMIMISVRSWKGEI